MEIEDRVGSRTRLSEEQVDAVAKWVHFAFAFAIDFRNPDWAMCDQRAQDRYRLMARLMLSIAPEGFLPLTPKEM